MGAKFLVQDVKGVFEIIDSFYFLIYFIFFSYFDTFLTTGLSFWRKKTDIF